MHHFSSPFPTHDAPVSRAALEAHRIGMSVLPIRADGSKRPALCAWKTYTHRLPTQEEVTRWFATPGSGLGLVTGAISGNLEALDFDHADVFTRWLAHVTQDRTLGALYRAIAWGYEEATPGGGRHLLYRCAAPVGPSQKLASRLLAGQWKTTIETRSEQSIIIVAPSAGHVHPSGKPYQLLSGDLSTITTITQEQRTLLLASTRQFDEQSSVRPQLLDLPRATTRVVSEARMRAEGQRPGDLLNSHASWDEILSPHGWTLVRSVGDEGYWRRPGKEDDGVSATTNFGGSDLLYVFTTSSIFEAGRSYTKFGAYTLLNHQGDFAAAARDLATQHALLKARYDEPQD